MGRGRAWRLARRCSLLTGLAALLCGMAAVPAPSQEKLAKEKAQYAEESDPVRKAKLLGEMGPLEVDEAHATFKSGSDEKALDILKQYNDEVQKTTAELMAAKPDAVRHPAGFKELQIGLRVSLRRLDDFILAIPVDKRPWFREVRTNLADVQNKLIDALFRTGEKPGRNEDADKNEKDPAHDKDQQP